MEYSVDFKPRSGHGLPAHALLKEIVAQEKGTYEKLLNDFLKYSENIQSIKKKKHEVEKDVPVWNNDFLPGLDIISIYGMLSHFKPKKYIEIGSGNSTLVANKAIIEQKLDVAITSIDPYPRASIDQLANTVIREPIEDVKDLSFIWKELQANDILFIDNSHRALPNSDVTVCFLDIIPNLKKGVIVQIHDIYIPFDYPQFMCDRFYSEQYMLATLLLANRDKYKPLFPAFYISETSDLKKIISPIWDHPNLKGVERHGGGFWFQIN